MIFTAYYDESGTHQGSPITVLAGFVGDTDGWIEFDREWRKILLKYDLRFIRAKQMFHRQSAFAGWSAKQIGHLAADIMYVLQERRLFHVSKIVLKENDYRRYYVGDGPISKRERLDTRYGLCLRSSLNFHPMLLAKLDRDSSINFVLEAGHRNAGDALRVFNEIKDDRNQPWSRALCSISFGAKTDFPALQAADLVAYWLYKTEMQKITENIDDPYEVSALEMELANCWIQVIERVINPLDLARLRQNFLAKKNKRKVFDTIRAISKPSGEQLARLRLDEQAYDPTNVLIGSELSAEQASPEHDQIPYHFRQRRRREPSL